MAPNRKWFGNTRVIGQKELDTFRDTMSTLKKDPYSFVVKQNKLPMSLLADPVASKHTNLLKAESFESTFGKKSNRKRPRMASSDMSELLSHVEETEAKYDPKKDTHRRDWSAAGEDRDAVKDHVFSKGQSKRIWSELYKVIDASDVVIQVLDARDPMGTRSKHIEEYMRKEKAYKQLVFVLNKCDLVPNWSTAGWVATLSKVVPTLAFHASVTNSYGKGALIQLLRQFGKLHSDKQQISVGFIGYPNVGKSSIINTLRAEKVCRTAPIPGETKVWQYVTLMRRIFLVDCPGVVYNVGDSEADSVLKGVVRLEKLKTPVDYVKHVLERSKPEYVCRQYDMESFDREDHIGFLEKMATRYGRLLKGGEPDIHTCAIMVLHDWQMGKIPYFTPPPKRDHPKSTGVSLDEEVEGEVSALQPSQKMKELPAKEGFFNASDQVAPEGHEIDAEADAAAESGMDAAVAAEDIDEAEEEEEEELTWDDIQGASGAAAAADEGDDDDEEEDGAEAAEEERPLKRRKREGGAESAAPAAAAVAAETEKSAKKKSMKKKSKKVVKAKAETAFSPGPATKGKKSMLSGWSVAEIKSPETAGAGPGAGGPAADAADGSKKKKSTKKSAVFASEQLKKQIKKAKKKSAKAKAAEEDAGQHDAEEEDDSKYRKVKKDGRKSVSHGKTGAQYYDGVNTKNRKRFQPPKLPK